ncbi:hypothetical protein D3C85_1458830 [compost metagenome]
MRLPKLGRLMAAWASRFQSSRPMVDLATYSMICEPPGEPTVARNSPLWRSKIRVGAMDERGRLPGSTRLATFCPFSSGMNEKSVISLLSMKP